MPPVRLSTCMRLLGVQTPLKDLLPQDSSPDAIALIRDRLDFLSATDRDWMLRRTAEKVFFA